MLLRSDIAAAPMDPQNVFFFVLPALNTWLSHCGAVFPAGPRRAQRDGSKLPLALRRQSSFRWGVLLVCLQNTYCALGNRHSKYDSRIKDALTKIGISDQIRRLSNIL